MRALMIAATALLLAGCGTTKVVTVTKAAARTPTTANTRSTAAAVPTTTPRNQPAALTCADAIMLAGPTNTCSILHTNVRVARGTQPLHLKAMTVQLVGTHEASTVSDGYGQSATANGEYLIVTLKITNRASGPETFDGIPAAQTLLAARGKVYSEVFDAENTSDPQSFLSQQTTIQPGESETGDVIFDLPPARAAQAARGDDAAVFVGNFGYSFTGSAPPHHGGMIVLKHP